MSVGAVFLRGASYPSRFSGSAKCGCGRSRKLCHHGFDDCYEAAHPTIDTLSAGHSRQAADIIAD